MTKIDCAKFWEKVDKADQSGCWIWTGTLDGNGYGKFSKVLAHRLAYELSIGEIPKGMVVDHECHNRDIDCVRGRECIHRRCVNPKHLKSKTISENVKAFPKKNSFSCGHPYTQENVYTRSNGKTLCRRCRREQERARKSRRKVNGTRITVKVDRRCLTEQKIKVAIIASRQSTINRLMKHVEFRGDCWVWIGGKDSNGYGIAHINGKSKRAPKTFYELYIGLVPDAMVLDHTCHTKNKETCTNGGSCPHRACVNPKHLEPVSNAVNIERGNGLAAKNATKTHCVNGHELIGNNLGIRKPNKYNPKAGRYCRECLRLRSIRYRNNNLDKLRKYDREWKRKNIRDWPESDISIPKTTRHERQNG